MRRGLIALAATGAVACASATPPPGGPEDHLPPHLVRVSPDTNAVNVRPGHVSFYFDETINDRGSGAQEVGKHFLVSPSDGSDRVSWHRSRIDVRPHEGFRPNTAYSISLLPGLGDLRGNVMKTGATVVFSTGATIPTGAVEGIAFDWVAERPAALAFVQATTPDSVRYLAQTDSGGHFKLGPLPPGRYAVQAIVDANGNRALDRNEAFDSATVVVPLAAPIELRTAVRDTLPPRVLTVTTSDSVTLRVEFDHLIDPTQTLAVADFRLVASDSSAVPVAAVQSPREEQAQALASRQAIADSTRRADSLAGKPLAPLPRPAPATTKPPAPKPSLPPPFTTVLLKTSTPLAPNATYRLTVSNVRGLTGRAKASERSFTTPKPPPPPPPPASDSTRAPGRPASRP